METLELGGVEVDVIKKDIKNVHLTVHPPTGRVRVSAPLRMSTDSIRRFAISKLGWIRAQQKTLGEQERESPREYLERESHYVWGRRYLLKIEEREATPMVTLEHSQLRLQVRPGSSEEKREELVAQWYREEVRGAMPELLARWEPRMEVRVGKVVVQHMKTMWGSCNPKTGTIHLNTELAKKPPRCLEYVLVHEMAHMHEPTHNARFQGLMDRYLPMWRERREELNRAPLAHEEWGY